MCSSDLVRVYIELSRNTPLLIQLFFLYYGLPKIGIHWDGFTCGVIALTFLGGSYMAEALRTGLQAVPRGQVESARAIGLKRAQVLWHVVLPQALAIALPALTANALFLVKETSVINADEFVEYFGFGFACGGLVGNGNAFEIGRAHV